MSETLSVFLSERAGTSGKLLLGVAVGVGWGLLKIFASTPLDFKKTPFLSTKLYLILDRIRYLLFDIKHK